MTKFLFRFLHFWVRVATRISIMFVYSTIFLFSFPGECNDYVFESLSTLRRPTHIRVVPVDVDTGRVSGPIFGASLFG